MARPHSLFHGTLLLTAASLALRGSSMCFQVYLAGRIGAAGIGLLQLISSVGMLAMTLGSAGVRVAAMYLTAEEYGARRPGGMRKALLCCLIYGLAVSLVGGAVLYLLSPNIAVGWIHDPRAASSLRVMACTMPFSCLWSIAAGYLTACSRIRQLVLVEFVDQAISIVVTVALLVFWAGANTERACVSIHLGNAAATVLTLAMLLTLSLRDRRVQMPKGLSMWRRLLRLCVPLAANDALRSGLSTTEQLIIPPGLGRSGASSEAAMASYGTIQGMVFPVMMFPAVLLYSLSDLLVPELAKCRAAKDQRRIRGLSDRCLRMGLLFAGAVAGLCHCLSAPLSQLLYHSDEAGFYLRLFAPLVLVLYMDALVDGMHKGMGEQVYCVRVNTLTNLLDVIFLWLTLPRWGITGYFFTFTFTHLLNFFLSITHLMTVTHCRPPLAFVIKVLLVAVLATVAAGQVAGRISTPLVSCLCAAGVYLLVFAALLLLTAALPAEDRRWLRSILSSARPASAGS